MNQPAIQPSYDTNSQIRTAVNRLTELLEWLHPEPSPDIFTVRDYRNRYPFTRLGPLATNDIDRYQRINRAVGDHVQLGLCEYHIGLIYLHEGEFRGAVQQFALARQQWSFVNQPAAVSLTHLARAVALQHADHYESAMVSAGRVAGWLARARFAKPVLGWHDFHAQVLAYVTELQAALRKQMEGVPKTAVSDNDEDKPADPAAATPSAAPAQVGAITTTTAEAETRPDGEIVSAADTPRPIFNMGPAQGAVPLPGHRQLNERYAWYVVEIRPSSGFMPDINPGDWLLVDLQPSFPEDVRDTEHPILVVMDKKIKGTIRVRPSEDLGRSRIYLATLDDSPTGFFWRNAETGTVTFSPEMAKIDVNRREILGVVVGYWRPMFEQLPTG